MYGINNSNQVWPLRGLLLSFHVVPGGRILFASWYVFMARANCLTLFRHFAFLAASRAEFTAGSSNATRIPMIAMTTRSSTRVKAALCLVFIVVVAPRP